MAGAPRVALKVDCDTYQGTRRGLPNLISLFAKVGIKASFFFTLGPDRSGRAIFRVFTQRGFLRKMTRSNAAALYGVRTMLYGTLLPAPHIGRRCAAQIRSVGEAGHEVGVHSWDHVRWHDRLDRMSESAIEHDYGSAHGEFERIFGRRARASAAAGWHATEGSLHVQDRYGLVYASDTREGPPFFPQADGLTFKTLQIPTTLPTWDEVLGTLPGEDALIERYRSLVRGTEVHSIHTEVEGTARLDLFERQIEAWQGDGVAFVTLAQLAGELLAEPERVPRRRLARTTLPGRAGLVTTSALPP